jgi:hypothetical protein
MKLDAPQYSNFLNAIVYQLHYPSRPIARSPRCPLLRLELKMQSGIRNAVVDPARPGSNYLLSRFAAVERKLSSAVDR